MASSTPLTEANTTFTLALFKKITENNKSGNVFYSPLSISSALAMVLLGARGNTSTQMSEVYTHTRALNRAVAPNSGTWPGGILPLSAECGS